MYRRVAAESPRGEGSLAMLERILVLVLLGVVGDALVHVATGSAHVTSWWTRSPRSIPARWR